MELSLAEAQQARERSQREMSRCLQRATKLETLGLLAGAKLGGEELEDREEDVKCH